MVKWGDHFADMGIETILQVSPPQGVSHNYFQAEELHKTLNVLIKGDDGWLGSGYNINGCYEAIIYFSLVTQNTLFYPILITSL